MKRVTAVLLLMLTSAALFAGGIENNSNMSAGYMRNPSKNTETKKPDAVFYNPAGTAFMEEGLYIELGNQFINLNYTNEAMDTPLSSDFSAVNPILLYPNGEIVFNAGRFALFAGAGIAARGGTAEFDDGSFSTAYILSIIGPPLSGEAHSFDVSAIVYGEVAGGSYAVNDYVSVSAAARFIQGKRSQKLTLESDPGIGTTLLEDSESTADGLGGVFGIHINASEELDIAFQYQTKVKLEYEDVSVEGYGPYLTALQAAEGNKYNIDIPAVLGGGVGYQIFEDLYASLSFNYFFNKDALWETGISGAYDFDDSWEIGGGAEFTFNNMIALSGGVLYSKQGFKDDENQTAAPILDSITIATGVGLTFIEDLTIDIGLAKPIYFDADYETDIGDITLSRKLFLIGIGATYKIF